MTSFVNLFVMLATPATIKCSAFVPRSVSRLPRLWPVGAAAAVLQVRYINKGKFTHDYQSAMSLLVIDFTFLEGVIVNLWSRSWQLSTHTVTGSRHMSLKDRTAGKKYQILTPERIRR